jgi:hypothetical protein
MSVDWSKMGERKKFGFPGQLQISADQQVKIRILMDEYPAEIMYHGHHDAEDPYLKFLCIGSRNGCRFCEANNAEAYVKAKPEDKPYPWHSHYAGPVYVYETNEIKLLIGRDIWEEFVKPIGMTQGTVIHCDMNYIRKGKGKQTSYSITPFAPTPFTVDLSKMQVIMAQDYRNWLETNIAKARGPLSGHVYVVPNAAQPMTQPASLVPGSFLPPQPVPLMPAPMQGSLLPVQPAATQVVQPGSLISLLPVQSAVPAAPVEADTVKADRKTAQDEFGKIIGAKFSPSLADEVTQKHGKGKSFGEMDPADIRAAGHEYQQRIATMPQ